MADKLNMTTHEEALALNTYREDLLSGKTLLNHALSHKSRYGYEPPVGRRDVAHALNTLAEMMANDARLAPIASAIAGRINLYGTPSQLCAAVYSTAWEYMANNKYVDVIGRSGPEAGRYSSYESDWTLRDRVALHYWLELACRPCAATTPGVGWALQAVAKEVGFQPHRLMIVKRAA